MRWRRLAGVRQHDNSDCGAACIRSVALYFGLDAGIAKIRYHAGTDIAGTTVLGMVEAATALGFTAKGVRADPAALESLPLPAIAHLHLDGGQTHYVVVSRVAGKSVTAMDPRDGRVTRIRRVDFEKLWTGVLILLVPRADLSSSEGRSVVGRLWWLLRPHRAAATQALAGAVMYTVLGLATAIYVQKVVDFVLVDGNRNLLNLLGVGMVVVLLAQAYVGTLKSVLTLRTGQQLDAALLLGYHEHLLRLPQRFFDTMRVGEVISRVGDIVKIRAFLNDVCLDMMVNGLLVTLSFALMLAYDWRLALIMAAILPAYLAILLATSRSNRLALRNVMETAADLESQLVESVSAISTIKRFNLESRTQLRSEGRFVALLKAVYRAGMTALLSARGTDLVTKAAVVLLFWTGSGFVLRGEMSSGELIGFYTLLGYLTGPMTQLVGASRSVQDALIAAERVFDILDLETEARTGLDTSFKLSGDIEFQEVKSRYGVGSRVLDGVSLTIPSGKLTALVGPSGSGKSTLAAILQRLHPVEEGRVAIGGIDLSQVDPRLVRRSIGVVPQEVHLFDGTVLENLVLDDRSPDLPRLMSICETLELGRVLQSLPRGYDSVVGQNGVNFSAGQRQRIAVARALYRRCEILIFDEATSHLDHESERLVVEALRGAASRGCTVLLIAHRLATIAGCDRIIVLEGGRVAEVGTHPELLSRGGTYARLWKAQWPSGSPCDHFQSGRHAESAV